MYIKIQQSQECKVFEHGIEGNLSEKSYSCVWDQRSFWTIQSVKEQRVFISFCATRELRTQDHWEKKLNLWIPHVVKYLMQQPSFFLESSRGSEWFFHLGKKLLSETPAKPDILLWHGCEPWAAEKQTPRRSPSSLPPPSVPLLLPQTRRPQSNKLHLPRGAVEQSCSLRPFNLLAADNEL